MERSYWLRAKARELRRLAAEAVLELHRLADEHERRAIEIERTAERYQEVPLRDGARARSLH
jgi:hypothetical protein